MSSSPNPAEADSNQVADDGPSKSEERFPKRVRKSVQQFSPDVLMNFQKTEKSILKKNDRERKQAERSAKKVDKASVDKSDQNDKNNKK